MKVEAYRCDYCDIVQTHDYCMGVSPVQDAFDVLESNKSVQPEKAEVHFCLECYRLHVLNPASVQTHRSKGDAGEREYQKRIKELSYVFKQFIFSKLKREQDFQKKRGK